MKEFRRRNFTSYSCYPELEGIRREKGNRGAWKREGEHARPSRALLLFDRPKGSKLDREKRRVKRLQAHSLSNDVFERRMSTGSGLFALSPKISGKSSV